MEKLIIGSHVSFTKKGGLKESLEEALSYKANTFMIYTGPPQNTKRSPIDEKIVKEAKAKMEKHQIDIKNLIIHAPYIVNLATKDEEKRLFAINFLKEELLRAQTLGINKIVLHPGSHVGQGEEIGLKHITESLNKILIDKKGPAICLETMAGKGSELGKNFKQLKTIIDGVNQKNRIMVCLDTCHLNDAGYDLKNFDNLLKDFDKKIGLEKIACIHINDSKNPISSNKDRHENIGFGKIGFENLINIIYHPKLKEVPKILETPYVENEEKKKTLSPYKEEIEMIRNKKFNPNMYEEIRKHYSKS